MKLLLIFIPLQIFLFILGIIFAIKVFEKNPEIDFDRAYLESKPLIIVSFTLLSFFAFGAINLQFDSILEKMPLIFQRYSRAYTWLMLNSFVIFVSGFVLTLADKLNKKTSSYYPSLLLLNALSLLSFYIINAPISDKIKESKRFEGGFLQTTNYSCTSASVATVAVKFGIDTDEKKVAKLTGLTRYGATLGQIRYALNQLGIEFESINDKKDLKDVKPPAIIFIDHPAVGKEGHSVVFLGLDGEKYKIFDPLKGERLLEAKEIKKVWHGSGVSCFIGKKSTN